MKFERVIFDVDGVFTDGKFHYSSEGKIMKTFGDADSDAINILSNFLKIEMVTGDKRGFDISKKRIQDDMGYEINLVSTHERIEWIQNKYDPSKVIYMGDGIFDPLVFIKVGYSICPANGFFRTKKFADFVTQSKGGEGAVAEAVIHIIENILGYPFDIHNLKLEITKGIWGVKNK